MKFCPLCRTPYTDPLDNYCHKDGTTLVDDVPSDFASKPDTLPFPTAKIVTPYDWLHDMADAQAKDIGRYVKVEQVRFCFHEFAAPIPYLNFAADIRNKSVFDIKIEDAIEGYIKLGGEQLLGGKKMVYNETIHAAESGTLTITQRLTPDEVALVTKCEANQLGAIYYFDDLVMRIAARTQFPPFERTELQLPKHVGSKDTPFSQEIESLKAQLAEEKEKRVKPDITGRVKEIYSEWWANGEIKEGEETLFDYHFVIHVYLANHGAVTTIERFKLMLKVAGQSYECHPEPDAHELEEGQINWREFGAEKLEDLEKLNDAQLEHTRNGWLWFVVKRVPLRIEDSAKMSLELFVIDKDGNAYQLESMPFSDRKRNPFLREERIKEGRERMRQLF